MAAWFAVSATDRIRQRLRALPSDDEGGSMVFGAITLFTLVLFVLLVYQVGMTSGDRIQLQGAADAAAYSGALVEAQSLESIAFVNEGMAYVYYNELRYAVDAIVYATLDEFQHHADYVKRTRPSTLFPATDIRIVKPEKPGNPDAPPEILMGAPGNVFAQRLRTVQDHANRLIPLGKQWLADLHDAERLILAATPRLVARTAAQVAGENGAVAVAVSSDLDEAFRVARGPDDARAGFSDGHESGAGGRRADESLYRRYEKRKLAVDTANGRPVARELPSQWFDPATGEARGAYYQIRLCWNKGDWGHDDNPANYLHALGPYQRYAMGPPNGHWHAKHYHNTFTNSDPPVPAILGPHDYWHDPQDGAQEHAAMAAQQDMTLAPSEYGDLLHHAVVHCPTCDAKDGGKFSGYTQIKKTRDDAEQGIRRRGGRLEMKVSFRGDSQEPLPRPLKARAPLFRAGVTVAAWVRGSGVSSIFPRSPFGMLAVASAQVGLRRPDGTVSVATSVSARSVKFEDGSSLSLSDDPDYRNLFYASESGRGVRIGARLVPVGRDLTWLSGDPGRGLEALVKGNGWMATDGSPAEGPFKDPAAAAALAKRIELDQSGAAFVH